MSVVNNIRIDIDAILGQINENLNISDLHLRTDAPSSYRMNGDIVRDEQLPLLTVDSMETILRQLFKNNPQSFDKFIADKESDFSYETKDGYSYRVNAFFESGKIAITMRKINNDARKLEELMFSNLAEALKQNILSSKRGLFLVTGPTGSGKSTSITAMLDHVNKTRSENIITIEDPIEHIFKPDRSIISQRQVGQDTWSFKNALRAVMREDPNIIFVGEIRDTETAETTLSLAESGHLVFSTLHTSSSAHTLSRFVSFFPSNMHQAVADRLSNILIGIQSQLLVKRKDANARIGIFEILLNTTSIKNNLKKMDLAQIQTILEASNPIGMISLQQYAEKLAERNIIDIASVERLFNL